MKALHILPEAEEELAEAAAWYEARRAGLGVELIAIVDRAFEEIADAPLACGLWREDRPYRRKVLTRFPYVISFASMETPARSWPSRTESGVLATGLNEAVWRSRDVHVELTTECGVRRDAIHGLRERQPVGGMPP